MRIRTQFLSALGALALITGGVVSMTPAAAQFGGLGLGDQSFLGVGEHVSASGTSTVSPNLLQQKQRIAAIRGVGPRPCVADSFSSR